MRTHTFTRRGFVCLRDTQPALPNTKTRAGLFPVLETSEKEEEQYSFINVDGYEVREAITQVYDHGAQVLHVTGYKRWHDGEQEHEKMTRIALRYTFPQELIALLHYNGFSILRQYGDWNQEPLNATSPSIISVCRKRTSY